jgi:hypothetical protein
MGQKDVKFTVSVRQQTAQEEDRFWLALDVLLQELVRQDLDELERDRHDELRNHQSGGSNEIYGA